MAAALRIAQASLPAGRWPPERETGRVTLCWDDRCRRRARLTLDGGGEEVLLDLARTPRLADGDGLELLDGAIVRVVVASEPVLEIRAGAATLTRLAYHLGNRHLPIEILADVLIARLDPVVADMVRRLGGEAVASQRPFNPEPGAYDDHGHARSA